MADGEEHGKEIAKRIGGPHELDTDRLPWEKQSFESLPSFRAFALYRDLTYTTSLTKAAEMLAEEDGRNAETVRRQMGDWSTRHRWQERHDAYLRHLDQRVRDQRESRADRARRRYETAAATMSAKIIERVVADGSGDVIPLDVAELDFEGACRAISVLQKVEALATGQPTSVLKSAFLISSTDVERMGRDLCEILFPYIPEDRRPLAAADVQAYAESGQRT